MSILRKKVGVLVRSIALVFVVSGGLVSIVGSSDSGALCGLFNMLGGDCNVERLNAHPLADFSYSPDRPLINQEITFDASGSTPAAHNGVSGVIIEYQWTFNYDEAVDENVLFDEVSDLPIIKHTYAEAGSYRVRLVVVSSYTGEDGREDRETGFLFRTVVVSEPDSENTVSPTANLTVSEANPQPGDGVIDVEGFIVGVVNDAADAVMVRGAVEGSPVSLSVYFDANTGEVTGVDYYWGNSFSPAYCSSECENIGITSVVSGDTLEFTFNDAQISGDNGKSVVINGTLRFVVQGFTFSPESPKVGEVVTFDASTRSDSANIDNYKWDWSSPSGVDEELTSSMTTNVFDTSSDYTVSLRVSYENSDTLYHETRRTVQVSPASTSFNVTLSVAEDANNVHPFTMASGAESAAVRLDTPVTVIANVDSGSVADYDFLWSNPTTKRYHELVNYEGASLTVDPDSPNQATLTFPSFCNVENFASLLPEGITTAVCGRRAQVQVQVRPKCGGDVICGTWTMKELDLFPTAGPIVEITGSLTDDTLSLEAVSENSDVFGDSNAIADGRWWSVSCFSGCEFHPKSAILTPHTLESATQSFNAEGTEYAAYIYVMNSVGQFFYDDVEFSH